MGPRGAEEGERPAAWSAAKPFEEQAAEQQAQHAHRQEEAGRAAIQRSRPGKAAAGDDHVDMGMVGHGRAQVWSTAVSPMRAPRCLGSAAIRIMVVLAARNSRS